MTLFKNLTIIFIFYKNACTAFFSATLNVINSCVVCFSFLEYRFKQSIYNFWNNFLISGDILILDKNAHIFLLILLQIFFSSSPYFHDLGSAIPIYSVNEKYKNFALRWAIWGNYAVFFFWYCALLFFGSSPYGLYIWLAVIIIFNDWLCENVYYIKSSVIFIFFQVQYQRFDIG